MDTVVYLNRREQAEYLKSRGLKISPNTLQKMATLGGGPRYVLFGNRALSTPTWLDEWVKSKMSSPRSSTSEEAA